MNVHTRSASPEYVALTGAWAGPIEQPWEKGGVYPRDRKPQHPIGRIARRVRRGEPIAVCPQCGQRFAGVAPWYASAERLSAEENLDRHRYGTDDTAPHGCSGRSDSEAL
jgi:hypothetical protein